MKIIVVIRNHRRPSLCVAIKALTRRKNHKNLLKIANKKVKQMFKIMIFIIKCFYSNNYKLRIIIFCLICLHHKPFNFDLLNIEAVINMNQINLFANAATLNTNGVYLINHQTPV